MLHLFDAGAEVAVGVGVGVDVVVTVEVSMFLTVAVEVVISEVETLIPTLIVTELWANGVTKDKVTASKSILTSLVRDTMLLSLR